MTTPRPTASAARRRIALALLSTVTMVGTLVVEAEPAQAWPNSSRPYPVVVSSDGLRIRKKATTDADVVGGLFPGDLVRISCTSRGPRVGGPLGANDLWDNVGEGFVPDSFIQTSSSGPVAKACDGPSGAAGLAAGAASGAAAGARVDTADGLRVRSAPTTTADNIIDRLRDRTPVTITCAFQAGGRRWLQLASGGWVADYVTGEGDVGPCDVPAAPVKKPVPQIRSACRTSATMGTKQLADEWLFKGSSGCWNFKDGDRLAEELRNNDPWLRDLTEWIVTNGGDYVSGKKPNDYPAFDWKWRSVWKSLNGADEMARAATRDPDNLMRYFHRLSDDPDAIVTYLGSYKVEYRAAIQPDGRVAIEYIIGNITNWESATRFPGLGYWGPLQEVNPIPPLLDKTVGTWAEPQKQTFHLHATRELKYSPTCEVGHWHCPPPNEPGAPL